MTNLVGKLAALVVPIILALLMTVTLSFGEDAGEAGAANGNAGEKAKAFALQTAAFQANGEIPVPYTCSGADISPKLNWTGVPAGTQTLVLIVDDPDAPRGTFTHWVLYNLRSQDNEIPENLPNMEQLPGGARQGRNSFDKIGYGGPCPPPGKPHRYYFKLYALDTELTLSPGAARPEVEHAMRGHILGNASIMGKFKR